jgi:hypothetical protein
MHGKMKDSLQDRKRKAKKVAKEGLREKNDLIYDNTPMLTNWVQIEMGEIFNTIKFHHNKF